MSRYPRFDRHAISLRSFQERGHDLSPDQCFPLAPPDEDGSEPEAIGPQLDQIAREILRARSQGRAVILMMGAHPIKLGLSRFLIDCVERGWVTLIATNGAGMIHDFELALGEGTSEDVARWIKAGQFGLWRETGDLNAIVAEAARRGEGLGEAVGRFVTEQALPRADLSIAAAGWRNGIPVTSHVSIGSDIIHAHANFDGAAFGAASHTDFLIFAEQVRRLEGGVYLNVGSAVTGPEVYLKALSMARNVARQQGEKIRDFLTAVFDLVPLPASYADGPPSKDHAMYYYRPWKTILVRTVADGGRSLYVCGDHRRALPGLWARLASASDSQRWAAAS